MLILILRLVFWNSKPKSIFWTNLSQKTWILHFAWRPVHRVSWGWDCKNTEQGLEEKIKWIIILSACCSYVFIVAKSKKQNRSTKECRINRISVAIEIFLIKKVLLQPKLWNKIETAYELLHIGVHLTCIQLLAYILRSYFRVDTHICWMESNPDGHLLNGFRF